MYQRFLARLLAVDQDRQQHEADLGVGHGDDWTCICAILRRDLLGAKTMKMAGCGIDGLLIDVVQNEGLKKKQGEK